jgi:flavin reductase (DIM6/NTAB) family NADH-FMN oxidoreductase RutF
MTVVDSSTFRHAMSQFATGVTVITTDGASGPHGMTANAVTSVSLDPPLILVCVGRSARLSRYLLPDHHFAVNVLSEVQEPLARFFSGAWPKTRPVPYFRFERVNDAPVLTGALATLVCEVGERYDGGDHHIVIGSVRHIRVDSGLPPLLFFGGGYQRIGRPSLETATEPQRSTRARHEPRSVAALNGSCRGPEMSTLLDSIRKSVLSLVSFGNR